MNAKEKLIKVLVVGGFDGNGRDPGGVTAVLLGIKSKESYFRTQGYETEYFNTCIVKRDSSSNGTFSTSNLLNLKKVIEKLRTVIKKNAPDIVFLHSSVGLALLKDCFLAQKIKIWSNEKTRILLEIHSADKAVIFPSKRLLKRRTVHLMNKNVDSIATLSNKVVAFLHDEGVLCKSFVLPNFSGIRLSQDKMLAKIKNEEKKKLVDILYIGSVRKEKGIFELLEAFSDPKISNVCSLSIAGGFVGDDNKQAFLKATKDAKNIKYVGFIAGKEKDLALYNSSIMVLPSYSEGFPVSLTEGISYGCYIIATDVGGIPEFFSDCGEIIKPKKSDSIKQAIWNAIEDKPRMVKIQESNYNYSKTFSIEKYAENIVEYYKKLLTE